MAPEACYEFALGEATLRVRLCSASDVGNVRKNNEDSFLAALPVSFVADGMGGHALGDRASQTVVTTFETLFPTGDPTRPETVVSAISRANEAVYGLTTGAGDARSIAGTTLAGVALVTLGAPSQESFHWMSFNVGDSRVYSWDGTALSQVTVDHSTVQELVDRGLITPKEAAIHPQRNVITRAVGIDDFVDADVWLTPVGGRQLYLMCSDGLTKEVNDAAIATVLREFDGDRTANPADRLVAMALSAGGVDNVTVVVVESEVIGGTLLEPADDAALPEFLEDTLPRRQRI